MQKNPIIKSFFILGSFLFLFSCKNQGKTDTNTDLTNVDPKVAKLKLPEGFHADHLYGPSENEEGSWVSMTFDDKGRILASDQYGAIYRMQVPAIGDTVTKIKTERINIPDSAGNTSDTSRKKVSIGYA